LLRKAAPFQGGADIAADATFHAKSAKYSCRTIVTGIVVGVAAGIVLRFENHYHGNMMQ
jgi:hypothetical protein